jgi:hypothetical protein
MDALTQLCARHPKLFRLQVPPSSDLPPGWGLLFDHLCSTLEHLLAPDHIDAFTVTQVKEKFGGLRFYFSGPCTPAAADAIEVAEALSERTCMTCGAPGWLRQGGYVVTLCDHCDERRREKMKRLGKAAP